MTSSKVAPTTLGSSRRNATVSDASHLMVARLAALHGYALFQGIAPMPGVDIMQWIVPFRLQCGYDRVYDALQG